MQRGPTRRARLSRRIVPALEAKGTPTMITGSGLPESSVHSPNEKFLYRYFDQGIDTAAGVYTELGKL